MEARCRLCFEERSEMERIFPDNDDEDDIDYESQMAIKIFKCTSLQVRFVCGWECCLCDVF